MASGPSGKRVGGLRRPPQGPHVASSARGMVPQSGCVPPGDPGSTPGGSSKKVGGLVAGSRRSDACTCTGSVVQGIWIHAARCPSTVILWFAHGFKPKDWSSAIYRCCPYECEGVTLPSGVTHHHACLFWSTTDVVPFGMVQPRVVGDGPDLPVLEEDDDDLPF